jgi:hypothetical protein
MLDMKAPYSALASNSFAMSQRVDGTIETESCDVVLECHADAMLDIPPPILQLTPRKQLVPTTSGDFEDAEGEIF